MRKFEAVRNVYNSKFHYLIDAHLHIDQYGNDLPIALEQIRTLSICSLAVSMDIPSYHETVKIAKSEPLILPSFGIHPWNAPEYTNRLDEIDELLETAPAIGEIGLDHRFVEDKTKYQAQETVFRYQLEAAENFGKLINLHTSGAEDLILQHLKTRSLPAVIVHWYNGPMEIVKNFLDLGAYFTIGVEVFQSERIRKLASILPEDRILTETDNPNGWEWLHGEPGFPTLIENVESEIAEIRNLSRPYFSDFVSSNFKELLIASNLSQFCSLNS